jgi:hypothetical protein
VHKKKKHQKKNPRDLPPLTPEQETLVKALLQDLGGIDRSRIKDRIPSPRIAHALIERMPAGAPEGIGLILAMREAFDRKDVQKAIKKALFRLRQRGIAIPAPDTPPTPSALPARGTQGEPDAFLGTIDGFGNRPVFVALPQFPKGFDVGMGILNDELGIQEFLFGRYSKKRMKEVKDLFFERFSPMTATSLSHAATVLEGAYGRNEGGTGESVNDYLQLRPWILENVPIPDRSPVFTELNLEISSGELTPSRLERLLAHPLMESWIIDPEKISPLIREISEAEQSPILVSEGQKVNRISEIKEKAVSEFFPDSKRALYKNRLEEMAYVFLKEEDEPYARICLAAAASLNETSPLLGTSPFLMALVDRTLDMFQKDMEIGDEAAPLHNDSTSIIIP